MGANDSKPVRPPSRANTLSTPPSKQAANAEQKAPSTPTSRLAQSLPQRSIQPEEALNHGDELVSASVESPYNLPPAANYNRPPRLPLPIEEEIHTPGSPIIAPQDVKDSTTLLEQADVEVGALPRKASVLSSTTVDDDDIGDNEAFAPEISEWRETRVPTKLEWNGIGEKIFVTGTYCNWEKKVKLHKNKDKTGFSAVLNLRPGTHHVKFLVDGEMMTSNDLPTTVDWTNILVNYIEIVAPMPAVTEEVKQPPAPAGPMPIPGAAITAGQATETNEPVARPLKDGSEAQVSEAEVDLSSTLDEIVPLGERVDSGKQEISVPTRPASAQHPARPEPQPKPTKHKVPRPRYTNQIPDFLVDLDNYNNPDDERFQRAQRVAHTLPAPPSLPMFLSKSILNGTTPHKDDASVLIMPNHTVLNHLATSSIKSGVLATSGTTRYKRKFLTTIMYKPTSDDG